MNKIYAPKNKKWLFAIVQAYLNDFINVSAKLVILL